MIEPAVGALRTILRHLVVVWLVAGLLPVEGQELPTRDEQHFHFQISHAELFYDTKLLPDGAQVTTYLHQGTWRRFFFLVEDDDTPVSIVITPCASAVDWRLSLQDLPQGASGDSSEDDELFDQLEMSESALNTESNLLQTYSGAQAQTFTIADCPAGVLMLELRTRDRDASVQLYTTTTPHSDRPYPLLPDDALVDVNAITGHSVTLSWKASPSGSRDRQPIEYCVAVNERRLLSTQCAVLSELYGDHPPTAPPNAGFGFAWERETRKHERGGAHEAESERRDDVKFYCIGNKETYTVGGLRAGHQYYFNVFVVNLNTNRSTAYQGVTARTHSYNKTTALKDGKVLASFVKRSRGQKVFRFEPAPTADQFLLTVQPCAGRLQVEVIDPSGNVIARSITHDLYKLTLSNVTATRGDTYMVRISPKRHRSVSFRIFATSRPEMYPYPILAEDTAIRVFDRQRACTSLVVAWLGTERRLHYCLYIREASPPVGPTTATGSSRRTGATTAALFRETNRCISNTDRKRSEKVMCRSFRYKDPRRSVMTEMVRGLRPGTQYVIDVYARRPGGETLAYQTTRASTRDRC